jgi:hypothetical protein
MEIAMKKSTVLSLKTAALVVIASDLKPDSGAGIISI